MGGLKSRLASETPIVLNGGTTEKKTLQLGGGKTPRNKRKKKRGPLPRTEGFRITKTKVKPTKRTGVKKNGNEARTGSQPGSHRKEEWENQEKKVGASGRKKQGKSVL